MPKKPKKWSSPKTVERTEEFLKRSAASRKGWIKRHKRELPKKIKRERKLVENAKLANPRIGRILSDKSKITKEKLTVKQLKRELEQVIAGRERAEEKLRQEMMTKGWVPTSETRYLRENYTIALEPSRLRHNVDTMNLKKQLEDASGGNFGVAAMDLSKRNRRNLRAAAEKIAENYEVDIREVYTLFYSP